MMVEGSADETRARLYVFYEQNNPGNAHNVEQIVQEFSGREAELWAQLSQKYGESAVRSAVRCVTSSAEIALRRTSTADGGREGTRDGRVRLDRSPCSPLARLREFPPTRSSWPRSACVLVRRV